MKSKVMSLKHAIALAARARRSRKKVVTTNGCFDIVHVGHVRALAHARSLGDMLIVGINSDASVRRIKGPGRPVLPARERAEVLAALESVDAVFIFSTKTPTPWLEKVRPAVHVKSSDYSPERIVEKAIVEKYGGRVVIFPHTGKHSSTKIIEKIKKTL